jgi:hypothetical protein
MSEEKRESVIGPDVKEPQVNEAKVKESGMSDQDKEAAFVNAEGSQSSIAPDMEGVVNTEGIGVIEKQKKKEAEENPEKVEESKSNVFLFPKLFIKKEELIDVDVEIIFDPDSGDLYSITQPGLLDTTILESLQSVIYKFKFRPVSYDNMQNYRRQASFYDSQAGDLVINRLSLRSFFMINHLRETDMVDENGQPFKMIFDEENDNLSLETINKLYETVPALLDVVMTLFERKLLMLFQVDQ